MHEHANDRNSSAMDMVKWYNFTTFDFIGDLAGRNLLAALTAGAITLGSP